MAVVSVGHLRNIVEEQYLAEFVGIEKLQRLILVFAATSGLLYRIEIAEMRVERLRITMRLPAQAVPSLPIPARKCFCIRRSPASPCGGAC